MTGYIYIGKNPAGFVTLGNLGLNFAPPVVEGQPNPSPHPGYALINNEGTPEEIASAVAEQVNKQQGAFLCSASADGSSVVLTTGEENVTLESEAEGIEIVPFV